MIWTPAERRAWSPRRKLSVSQWAEAERIICSKDAAEPGKWHNARAPYLVGIMDALSDPAVEEVYVMKPARVGGSEIGRNFLGRTVAQDPGPFLIVFPDENLAKKQLANELIPLLESAPLREYLTESPRDLSKEQIELQAMRIYPAWAGSASTLAEKTCRYVWLSEVDKYPPFSGREADPMSLAKRRTQTYGYRRKIYAESTPTTRMGAIFRAWESAPAKYRFHVPCPHCGAFQVLAWPQVKWAKHEGMSRRDLAAMIEATGAAWYECVDCHGRIEEHAKGRLEELGEWRLEAGCVEGPLRAYHISGLLSMLGMTWARMVGQFLRACESRSEGDVGPLMDFVTQSLGEPFEDQVGGIKDASFERKRAKGYAPRRVPEWAGLVLATADTQRDGFWWVVRAWGRGERSRLIDRGRAGSFAELEATLRGARYPIDGWTTTTPVRMLAIDAGGGGDVNSDTSLTDEVYRFCLRSGGWAVPLKGWGGMGRPKAPVSPSRVTYTPPGGKRSPYDVVVNMVDTQYFKSVLVALIGLEPGKDADDRWELCSDVDEEYVRHMTAERKIAIRKGGGIVERWERLGNRPNHYFDCYDAKTEVLTDHGWKLFRNVAAPDRLATVRLETNSLEYQAPTQIIARDYSGFMVKIGGTAGSRLDLLVTPGHRMVVLNNRGAPSIRAAGEIHGGLRIKLSAEWSGNDRERVEAAGESVDAEAWAAFLGWYIAEGYCNSGVLRHKGRKPSVFRRVVVYQNQGPKYEAIAGLMARLPWHVQRGGRALIITNKDLYYELEPLGDKYTKRVPDWIKTASPRIIRAFLDAAVSGDGWRQGAHHAYATVSPKLADDIQELFLKAGYSANIRTRPPKPYDIRGRQGANTRIQYHVHRRVRAGASLTDAYGNENFSTVEYEGSVHCATVPNGTLVVRRNGLMAICGNCETYQLAAARIAKVDLMPDRTALQSQRSQAVRAGVDAVDGNDDAPPHIQRATEGSGWWTGKRT